MTLTLREGDATVVPVIVQLVKRRLVRFPIELLLNFQK